MARRDALTVLSPWSAGHDIRGVTRRVSLSAVAVLGLLAPTVAPFAPTAPVPDGRATPQALDFPRIADLLVERMSLQPGERVLLIAGRGRFEPLVPLLRERVAAAGAQDLGAISVTGEAPEAWTSEFTSGIAELAGSAVRERFRGVDLAVMLPGATPSHGAYAAMQDVLHAGLGRTIHFHWAGAYDLDGETLPVDARVDAAYENALEYTDYEALAAAQRAFATAMRVGTVRVTTPAGTDLRFEIGDRPVTTQDGDASAARVSTARNLIDREIELPAGAVRVAPLESTVEGTIVFPPSIWGGGETTGLTLVFEGGIVVGVYAESGAESAVSELDAALPASRSFREFALGFNPRLAIPQTDPWIPYYGYGAGVVRLSLGDNGELGGEVTGGYVRWNFFADATVTVGDDVWVRDGHLILP